MIYYVIYEKPSDFPFHFVVRRYAINGMGEVKANENAMMYTTLEAARRDIPRGKVCVPANPLDDKVIVETWI